MKESKTIIDSLIVHEKEYQPENDNSIQCQWHCCVEQKVNNIMHIV